MGRLETAEPRQRVPVVVANSYREVKGGQVVIRPRAAHLGGTSHLLTPSHACRFQIRVRGAKTATVGHSHRDHPGHLTHEADHSIIGSSDDCADVCR